MDLTMTLGGKLRNTVVCGTQTVEDRNKQQLTITALPQKNLDSRLCILEPLISGKIFALLPLLLKNLMLVWFFFVLFYCFKTVFLSVALVVLELLL